MAAAAPSLADRTPGRASAPPSRDRADAWLWALGAAALLLALPVGRVSPDGLAQAARAAGGAWDWNPNHLLLEPLGALVLRATELVAPERLAVDRLRWLSALAGAAAVGLFRGGLAPRLAASRLAATYATAWVALGSAFSRLWLSAECHVIQMPAVVLAAIFLLRLRERGRDADAAALGGAIGLAALAFSSLALLLPAALAALVAPAGRRAGGRPPRARGAAIVVVTCLATAGAGFAASWFVSRDAAGPAFLDWVLSYGGAGDLGRLRRAYGAPVSAGGLAVAAARALYGALSALVDLAPAVAGWRDRGEIALPACRLLAAVSAALSLAAGVRRAGRETAALALFLAPPVLLFGWAWNNSDDQFYLPLAVLSGALAARAASARPPAALALGLAALAWNLGDVTVRHVLYPRAERTAELAAALRDACLVVDSGFGEAEVLLALGAAPPGGRSVSLAALAAQAPPERGLPALRARIDGCLASGRAVALVGVVDPPPYAPPWKFLRALGWEPATVRAALGGLELEPPRGRFEVRRIEPPPEAHRGA